MSAPSLHVRSSLCQITICISYLGSLIGVRAEAYAKVRGVPKRSAGEDFIFSTNSPKSGTSCRSEAEQSSSNRRSNRFRLAPVQPCLADEQYAKMNGPPFMRLPAFKRELLLSIESNHGARAARRASGPAIMHYIESTAAGGPAI